MKVTIPSNQIRCDWATTDPLYIVYHDQEWGLPIYNEQKLFEFLILEGAQAGLSWITVLKKRENYRKSFDNFNAKKIANYDQDKIQQLLNNPGIIRNRLKIESAITNAQAYLKIQEQRKFSEFIWEFVNNKPIQNQWHKLTQVPASTPISEKMSKKLKKLGFKFVGSTICYAFMQAVGMVNDHLTTCFRHQEINMSSEKNK